MSTVSIFDGKMTVTVPEVFKIMSEEELKNRAVRKTNNNWAMSCEEKHLAVNIAWKKLSIFSKNVTPESSVLFDETNRIKNSCNNYERECLCHKTVAGQDACSLRFSYVAQEIQMINEYIIVKFNGCLYSIGLIGRRETFDENYQLFEDFLSSVCFA